MNKSRESADFVRVRIIPKWDIDSNRLRAGDLLQPSCELTKAGSMVAVGSPAQFHQTIELFGHAFYSWVDEPLVQNCNNDFLVCLARIPVGRPSAKVVNL
jgi:hypothetical protein